MANVAPVAVLTASKTEIKFPENKITLDLSGSTDASTRTKNQISHWDIYKIDGPDVQFQNQTQKTVDVIFTMPGTYTFEGKVIDGARTPLSNTDRTTINVLEADKKTIFGASGPTIDSPDILKKICGDKTVTRTSIELESYNDGGSREADKYLAADNITVFINCNLSKVDKDAQGNKIPNAFPKDLTVFKTKLEQFLQHYQNHPKKDSIIIVIENEPTTNAFHSGPIEDYLPQLAAGVALCKKYGFKVVDGGVHVDTVLGSDLSNLTGEGRAADVATLLAGYAKMPDLYAVNLHTSNATGNTYDPSKIVKAVQKIKQVTGHITVSNEWHSQNTDTTDALKSMTDGWSQAGVPFSVYITGTSDKNNELNSGTTLTKYGEAYQAEIIKLQNS